MSPDEVFSRGSDYVCHYALFRYTHKTQEQAIFISSVALWLTTMTTGLYHVTAEQSIETRRKKKSLVILAHRISDGSFGGKNEPAIVFCFLLQLHKQSR